MCGRYILKGPWKLIVERFRLIPADTLKNMPQRLNVAPTQSVPFIIANEDVHDLKEGQWWLVPHWAQEASQKYAMFNARTETAFKSPAFRDAWKTKRCLIPADGYYEWTKADDGKKDPWCITLPDFEPFAFAGLWATNEHLGITSCTIMTLPAHEAVSDLHKRMPVILQPDIYQEWLTGDGDRDRLAGVLDRNRGNELEYYRVNRNVNSSKYTGDDATDPV